MAGDSKVKAAAEIKPIESGRGAPEKRAETRLSDYYGVNQVNDAIVFVTLYPRASSVQIAGDFNNWQPVQTPMQKVGESGVWQTEIKLPSGKHRYRLVVDGNESVRRFQLHRRSKITLPGLHSRLISASAVKT